MAKALTERDILVYREKPLLRDGNTLYYGDFSENFIVRFLHAVSRRRGTGVEEGGGIDREQLHLILGEHRICQRELVIDLVICIGIQNNLFYGTVMQRGLQCFHIHH